jgi:hypothetical protein
MFPKVMHPVAMAVVEAGAVLTSPTMKFPVITKYA